MIWIGDWQLDLNLGIVQKDDVSVRLSPSSFQVLNYLIDHQGKLVSTETLLDEFWRGYISSDNAVHRSISELRGAFGDSPREQLYIKTVPALQLSTV